MDMPLELSTQRMQAHVADGIGWMTFNNPARHNALSLEMWQGIGDILEHFAENQAVRVVIMRGAGGKASEASEDAPEDAPTAPSAPSAPSAPIGLPEGDGVATRESIAALLLVSQFDI